MAKQKPTKIVLHMEGGCIQAVYTDKPVDITIVDVEELQEYGLSLKEITKTIRKSQKGLKSTEDWGFLPNPKAQETDEEDED